MKLSELNVSPLYPITIPSSKKKAKYRPFLVKEERALLAAQESEDLTVMLTTLKQVVEACVEPESAVAEMTSFDLEYIFTLIRSKSVGEYSSLVFRCDDCTDNDDAKMMVNLDLRKVEVAFPENVSNKVKLSEKMTVVMKYPSMDELIELESQGENDNAKIDAVKSCMVSIIVDDEVYNVREEPAEELTVFLETLTSMQFKLLEEFVDNIPSAQIGVDYRCPVCGKEHNKVVKGLNNFF